MADPGRLAGILTVTLALALWTCPPAFAGPGSAPLRFRFEGWLGKSGLYVHSTPQSLLVTRVARGQPAARAGIAAPAGSPAGGEEVVRLLAVNGREVGAWGRGELYAAFNPASGARSATVILGRRRSSDLTESLEGPLVLDLVPARSAAAFDLAGRGRWAVALQAAGADEEVRSAVVARMLFAAQRLAVEGKPGAAMDLLALVPRDDPMHGRALDLARQYESVTRVSAKNGAKKP